ncbi:hypothetical protein CPT_Shemara_076 [Salmonella phage Shemara]|uniref:Uncharacterized protein n=1 Tax=Salmonella phage Shemara TaxID=2596714 RepID=A0A5B8RRY6_9CAUD|nr:hypothetical protein PF624_gp76 [Salmonella phage Shemara]QEA10405.1 hypothetical protein CPT_Shemara_076 [Salmonella phage Shemara]
MEDLIYILSYGGGLLIALLVYWGLLALYHKGWEDGFNKGCRK